MSLIPNAGSWKAVWPFNMIRNPILPAHFGTLHSVLPKLQAHQALILTPPQETLKTVFYFPGCGSERLYSDIGKASLYLLLKSGTRIVLPPPFLCCGFPINVNAQVPSYNRKVLSDAIIFSQLREMLRYMNFDACVVSCGTCKEALQTMGAAEIFSAPLEDVSRFAVMNGLKMQPGGNYLYHRPCHDSMSETALPFFKKNSDMKLTLVPHCCSEAGTLAMSRPDIAFNMLDRKTLALEEALEGRERDGIILTNCPSCLQGLGRNAGLGVKPRHMAVELALRSGGSQWQEELKVLVRNAEVVSF
jgi:D-lactate dehydrogenase (cytochrome)